MPAAERHCSQCGDYFLGNWRYAAGGHDSLQNLRVTTVQTASPLLLLPTSRGRALGMLHWDLRLVTGILHRARGSFAASADILASMAGGDGVLAPEHLRQSIAALWFPSRLFSFLEEKEVRGLDWTLYVKKKGPGRGGRGPGDDWLYELRPLIRKRFIWKWLLRHVPSCPSCRHCFGLGLDGKRGAKRFLCAAITGGGRAFYPEANAYLYRGCWRAPLHGGKFCALHEEEAESGDEDEPELQAIGHREAKDGTIEYLIKEHSENGAGRQAWFAGHLIATKVVRAYEVARLPQNKNEKKKVKKRRKATKEDMPALPEDHVLLEHAEDAGACGIDKRNQAPADKKRARRRLGGVLAAVSGCRVFLDWEEHQGGESTTQTYLLLAHLVSAILAERAQGWHAKLPDVVFMDNACGLRAFAHNPLRATRTAVTKVMKKLRYMLDVWHAQNHTKCLEKPELRLELDPRLPENEGLRKAVDTEACEQAFAFLDRVTYLLQEMGPGSFHTYLYLVMGLENERLVNRRAGSPDPL